MLIQLTLFCVSSHTNSSTQILCFVMQWIVSLSGRQQQLNLEWPDYTEYDTTVGYDQVKELLDICLTLLQRGP